MASTTNASPPTLVYIVGGKPIEDKPEQTYMLAWWSAKWKSILAEFVSTMILVFFGCMACIPIDGLTEQSPYYAPLGFGLTVMFNIQIFGHISMAHMNPAVTLAGVIWGNTSVALGICYAVVQIMGAAIGYGVLISLAPTDVRLYGICVTYKHFGISSFQAMCIEAILTGVLSLLNCGVWDPVNQHKQDSVPIKFGLAIIGLSIIGGPMTGASMNPARTLGPALWTGIYWDHWIYWAGPLIGAGVTAILYKLIFLKKENYTRMHLL